MDQSQPVEPSLVGRPRFWVGPLLVGCCFAMGFGIADRVVSSQSDQNSAPTKRFAPSSFPGDSLQTLRSIHQDDANLQVDLAALNLTSPELGQAVVPSISTGTGTNLALQRPATKDRSWMVPTWSDPEANVEPRALSTESIPYVEQEQAPSSVLLAPPPEVVPPADASLLVVKPESSAFVAEKDALLLMPMQPLMPPTQP
jgi:hypothetical protein